MAQTADRDDDRVRVSAGYGYLSGDSTPLLVAKERRTDMVVAAAVSMKGGCDPHAARLLTKWVDVLEPGICGLVRRVRELRAEGVTTVDEVSPAGDSAANGAAERAILTIGDLVMTTKAACWSCRWRASHGVDGTSWRPGTKDALAPLRRLQGRKFGTPFAGFGAREPPLEKVNKFNPRCVEARLLGFCLRSSRHIVANFGASFRSGWTVKRTSFEDRWEIASPSDLSRRETSSELPLSSRAQRGRGAKSIPPPSVRRGCRPMSLHPVWIMSRTRRVCI